MIGKTLLYLVYFVKLSEEDLLNAEMPDIYDLAANVFQEIATKHPGGSNFHDSTFTSDVRPEISTASKSVQKFKKHNAYKNQKGYTSSEVFHNGVKDGEGTTNTNTGNVIPESRFLYHSLENPLFKSNSLNLRTDDDNELPIISDVHKISSPFESKWIFFPTNNKGLDNGLGSSTFDFLKKSRGIRNSVDSSFFTSSPFKSSSNHFGNSKLEVKPFNSSPVTATPVKAIDTTSTEKSFYGYNMEEVKTGDGKTRGIVQLFDKDGLKRNVVYNEKGTVVDQTVKTNATSQPISNTTASSKTKATYRPTTNAPSKVKQNNTLKVASKQNTNNSAPVIPISPSTTTTSPFFNYQFSNFTNNALPSEDVTYSEPLGNSFATPEYILYNFLGQLNSMPFIPSNENFVTNELTSIDESVDENAFIFVEK